MAHSEQVTPLSDFSYTMDIQTRWMDNDVYGHVNNVVYYSYFDTAVNKYLIEEGVLDPENSDVIGLVVETSCRYHAPVSFPETLIAGVGVAHIGNSSVRYEITLFSKETGEAVANGYFVHVYVDADTRKPVPLPDELKSVLEKIKLK